MSRAWVTILLVVLGSLALLTARQIVPKVKKFGFKKAIISVVILSVLIGFGIYAARRTTKPAEPVNTNYRGPMMWVEPRRKPKSQAARKTILFPPDPYRDPENWRQFIFENPDNEQIWLAELQRVKTNEELLLQLRQDPKRDPVQIELGIANNHQLKGIALRHLHRYQEALGELATSQSQLELLEKKVLCSESSTSDNCKAIRSLKRMTCNFFASVHQDLHDKTHTEKYLKLAVTFAEDDPEKYEEQLLSLVNSYVRENDYDQALETALQAIRSALAASKEYRIISASKAAESVYIDLFVSISWDPRTGMRREDDPNDFADMWGLGIGRPFKYGMVDPDEDEATFFTVDSLGGIVSRSDDLTGMLKWAKYGSVEELKRNADINAYVRGQMKEGNFEPVTKYLFFKYIDHHFLSNETKYLQCKKPEASDVTYDEVREALAQTPSLVVSAWTRHVIELFENGSKFSHKYCHPKGEDHVTKSQD